MPRYRLLLEYDGSGFVGWQRQANGRSVQATLEEAIRIFSGEAAVVEGAGRTDAGVHATGQVAHFDLARFHPPERVQAAINALVRPHPIAVLEVRVVDRSFHARLSAIERRYVYRILNRRAPPVLERGRVWHVVRPLDVVHMQEAARLLEGRHDFSSFRDAECQAASPVKTLSRLVVQRRGCVVEIRAAARSFLHHQVRNMVGTLVLVGDGRRPIAWVREVLEARDRRAAGPTAPACGLYLEAVRYPDEPLSAAGACTSVASDNP
ncbi:tRNA pseudouridine synthase A [bacterium HR40]|nr:tRNA pseudouridine synthase A [bacterium HR40]